MKKNYKVKTNR